MNIVITTIFPPTPGATLISTELSRTGGTLWVIGDRPGPPAYDLPSTLFFDINHQMRLPFRLARLLPEKHYSRKNLGYLLAIRNGVSFLVETDEQSSKDALKAATVQEAIRMIVEYLTAAKASQSTHITGPLYWQ